MAKIDFPKKQEQRLIPKYLLEYAEELQENHPDPTDPWGGSGGDVNIEAGTGITITTESDDTKVISLDTNPSTFEVTATTGMTLEVENQNPLYKDSKLQMSYTGATRLEGTQISLEANNIYLNSDHAPYYVNNTTHEYKTLATTDQLFSGNYNDLYNKPTIPDAVSGTNDGTNWTTLTIGNDTYGLASGGTTYTAGTGIDITNDTISVDTSTVAMKTDIPTVPTNVSAFNNDAGYITGINSSDVITALGYTPYDSSNPNGYITGITDSDVISALGYTPGTSNFSGSYTDLTDKPTIPTKTSELTNDSGFITNSDQNVEYIFITSTSSTPQPFTLTNDQIDAIVLNPTKYIIVYDYQPLDTYANRIYFKYQYQRTISGNIYFNYSSIDYYPTDVSITNGTNGYKFEYVTFTLTTNGTNKGTITMTNASRTYQKALTLGTGLSHSGDEISVNTNTIATRTWVGNQGYLTSSDISNMVTTDTDQTITGRKTIVGSTVGLYVQSGATYTSNDTMILPGEIDTRSISSVAAYSNEFAMPDVATTTQGQIRVRDFSQGAPFTDYRITVPTKNGTMALTSDIVTSYNNLTDKPDLSIYAQSSSLATVATSGSYNDLTNKPTIPTVNDNTITITQGGVTKGSFTLNQNTNQTIDVDDVPGMIGEVIYERTPSTGTTAYSINLSKDITQYAYVEVYYNVNDDTIQRWCQTFPNPAVGNKFNITCLGNGTSRVYTKNTCFEVATTTSLTLVNSAQQRVGNNEATTCSVVTNGFHCRPYKIIGYKQNSAPLTSETWTFTLQDGTTTTKKIMLG